MNLNSYLQDFDEQKKKVTIIKKNFANRDFERENE